MPIVIDDKKLHQASLLINDVSFKLEELFGQKCAVKFMLMEQSINTDNLEELIIDTVCNTFEISRESLFADDRITQNSNARFICYKLLKDLVRPRISLKAIGQKFSGRDHTTILHGLKKFQNYYDTEVEFRNTYNNIFEQIKFKQHDNNEEN